MIRIKCYNNVGSTTCTVKPCEHENLDNPSDFHARKVSFIFFGTAARTDLADCGHWAGRVH